MNKFAAEQNAIVEAMSKIASANGLPLTYPVAQKIAELHQYSPVLIMKTAFDISQLMEYAQQDPAIMSALGGIGGGALGAGAGALIGGPGRRGVGALMGAGMGAGLGAGAGYFAPDVMRDMHLAQLYRNMVSAGNPGLM